VICAFSKRPSQNIDTITNDFFKISTTVKNETFFITIKPIHKMRLFCEIFDLTKDDSLYSASSTLSKRWFIIGYEEDLPMIYKDEHDDLGINFPFFLDRDMIPYVGSLDIKGNPVHIKRVGDVREYIKVKEYFREKRYEKSLEIIEDILLAYPNTLFKAELMYYKIKVFSQLGDSDQVVELAKLFLREYSANENIAEVLSLSAKAYALSGLGTEAEYFFDRLFNEHQGSVHAEWGYIYRGEMFESSGAMSKAVEFYKKALTETSDIDVATTAAYRLATASLGIKPKESAQYIEKIVNAKPSFFIENIQTATKMMHTFADDGDYKTAASIAESILNEINASEDEYEVYLKDVALWLANTDEKQNALRVINRYIKEFPDGEYITEIEVVKDRLFFDTPDLNTSQRLEKYANLIEVYSHDTIGNRAVYERAKLLLELKEYEEIIATKEELLQLDAEIYPDKEKILTNAAIGLMERSLDKMECQNVLMIANEYEIELSHDWDDGVYECAMRGGDFQLAKRITEKNLQSAQLDLRKRWLYRYVKIDFAIGNYSEMIGAANDLIILIGTDKESEYKDTYRYLFDAYNRVERKDKLVETIDMIEEMFGITYVDIERYVTMISIASEKKDDNMVIKYAKKVMQIQKSSGSAAQSPFVEFALYQSYVNTENYNAALDVIKSLEDASLSSVERARQKYLLGSVYSKLWRDGEAEIAYKEAIEADANSPWAKLAQSALNL